MPLNTQQHSQAFDFYQAHNWQAFSVVDTLKGLKTSAIGLTEKEVELRKTEFGLNEFTAEKKTTAVDIFLRQFKSFLFLLLFLAGILSFAISQFFDGLAIFLILIINAIVGFFQEYQAEQALQELKKIETPLSTVKRDNQILVIESKNLVPGDILVLKEGDKIPADARLIENYSIEVDQSALTGESQGVEKSTKTLSPNATIPDTANLVFAGTIVNRGKGLAVVYATGDNTQLGHIAHLVQTTLTPDTPLQKTLERLSKVLGIISIAIAAPGLIIGLVTHRNIIEMIMLTISLAVSAIPEGLPIVVTLALAIGTRRMLKKHVLIRKLPAVEALGSVDVICTDKTGTLTRNQMTVTDLILSDQTIANFDQLKINKQLINKTNLNLLAQAAIYCSDAQEDSGEPTEKALIKMSAKLGFSSSLRLLNPRLDEIPFNSSQKYMATLTKLDSQKIAFIKGAPELILKMCQKTQIDHQSTSLTDKKRELIANQVSELTSSGKRVLAFGYKVINDHKQFHHINDYVFLGLVGMIDPPRENVIKSLEKCAKAGVKVIMITGDHPLTALSIAKQIHMPSDSVITGDQLDKFSRQELEGVVENHYVFARVSPENKLQILQALHNQGHLVAMTGDGVNDAPALKEADIGISVGDGTDLAREVSDMVLLDNNFNSIVTALREARGIFFNIKKFIAFLLAANFDEIFIILLAIILETPLPLLPIHLLWLNVITDSLPALALSVDNYDEDVMIKPPYDPKKEIISGLLKFSVAAGLLGFAAGFLTFLSQIHFNYSSIELAQTLTFTVTVLFELFLIFSVRSEKNAFKVGLFSNKTLLLAIASSAILQILAIYLPITQKLFNTVPFPLSYWPAVILTSLSGFVIIELVRGLKYGHLMIYIRKVVNKISTTKTSLKLS